MRATAMNITGDTMRGGDFQRSQIMFIPCNVMTDICNQDEAPVGSWPELKVLGNAKKAYVRCAPN